MQPSSTSSSASVGPDTASRDSIWRGFVSGLFPLAPLAVVLFAALALAALARPLTSGLGFGAQQLIAIVIVGLGLLGAAVSYVVFCRRALRRVKGWQQVGWTSQANGALWGLVVVALLMLLPLLLAVIIPQSPAPNLAP